MQKADITSSRSYALTKRITFVMDRCLLDPILGLIPGLDSFIGIFCVLVYVYVSKTKVRSNALTFAIIYNYLRDTLIGIIPFFIGDILDFFNHSYVRSQELIDGYVAGNREIIIKVERQSNTFIGLCALCIILIFALLYIVFKTTAWLFSFI